MDRTKLFSLILILSLIFLTSCGNDSDDTGARLGPESNIVVETISFSGNYTGDDGISIDSKGALYVSHLESGRGETIFKIASGESSIFAGNLPAPMGHVFDENDTLYVAFNGSSDITKIDPQGNAETYVSSDKFTGGSLAIDSDGALYHSVFTSGKIFRIDRDKTITEIASGLPLSVPFGITLDPDKNIYVANFSDGKVNRITQDGTVTTITELPTIIGYLIYANGQLYATGFTDHRIYSIELDGTTSVLIGTGVPGSNDGIGAEVTLASPNGIVASQDGNTLYVTQKNNLIRKLTLE